MNNRTRTILLIIGALFFGLVAWYFRAIVAYLLISAVLGVIGRPIVRWLTKVKIWKIRFGPSFSAFIALIVLWAFFFSFFRFTIPVFISEFDELAKIDINQYLTMLEEPVNKVSLFVSGKTVSLTDGSMVDLSWQKISSVLRISKVTDIFETIMNTLGSIMVGLFSISFITYFFLRDENMFKNGLLLISPTDFEERVSKSIDRISYLLRRYFIGLILEVIMVAALDTIGLVIVGLDFYDALIIGLLCGLFNVIPYLGPWIGALVGVLIGLALNVNFDFMGHTLPLIVYMIIVFSAVQVIDNVVFQPLIYSSSVKAHPLEIFLVIMAAGSLAGVLGMILAIPVYSILRVFGAEFLSGVKIVRKITENMDQAINKDMK